MKKYTQGIFLFFFLMVFIAVSAQEDKHFHKRVNNSYMERFEPELLKSFEERLVFKKRRIAELERSLSIIDTIDISERRRKALRKDLETKPFSQRLYKTLTKIKFEEEIDE